jgi:hypothetical protein
MRSPVMTSLQRVFGTLHKATGNGRRLAFARRGRSPRVLHFHPTV